jgi:hypothetical protein
MTRVFPAQRRSDFCCLGEPARLAGESAAAKSPLAIQQSNFRSICSDRAGFALARLEAWVRGAGVQLYGSMAEHMPTKLTCIEGTQGTQDTGSHITQVAFGFRVPTQKKESFSMQAL